MFCMPGFIGKNKSLSDEQIEIYDAFIASSNSLETALTQAVVAARLRLNLKNSDFLFSAMLQKMTTNKIVLDFTQTFAGASEIRSVQCLPVIEFLFDFIKKYPTIIKELNICIPSSLNYDNGFQRHPGNELGQKLSQFRKIKPSNLNVTIRVREGDAEYLNPQQANGYKPLNTGITIEEFTDEVTSSSSSPKKASNITLTHRHTNTNNAE